MSDVNSINLNQIEALCGETCEPATMSILESAGDKTIDTTLVRQLRDVDHFAGNSPDGFVSEAEILRANPRLAAPAIFDAWTVRAAKLAGVLLAREKAQMDLALEPALVRSLEAEADPHLNITTSRLEIVEEILSTATAGYFYRDVTAAGDGIVGLTDLVTFLGRKPLEWIAGEAYSMEQIEIEAAYYRAFLRKKMASDFMLGLEKILNDGKSHHEAELKEAMTSLAVSVEATWSKHDLPWWMNAQKTVVESRKNKSIHFAADFPIGRLAKILSLPKGQVHELSRETAQVAKYFLDEQNNWAVALFLAEEISATTVADPLAKSIASELKQEIEGNPEQVSDFWAALVPPFWAYNKLPAEQRYTMAADLTGFVLPFVVAGPTYNAAGAALQGGSARLSHILLSRLPRLERFLALTAEASPQRIALAETQIESLIKSGAKSLPSENEALKFLVTAEPGYVLKLTHNGIKIDEALITKATRQLELQTLTLGPKMESVARALGWTGDKAWRLWRRSFGLFGRGFSSIMPAAVALGKKTAQGLGALPHIGHHLARGARITGDVIVTMGQGVSFNWRGQVVCWWGLQAIGEPFLRTADSGADHRLPYSEKLGHAILALQQEVQVRGLGERIIIKELDGLIEDYLGPKSDDLQPLLDALRTLNNPTQSRADIKSRLLGNPALAELRLMFVDNDSVTELSSHHGRVTTRNSAPIEVKPFSLEQNSRGFRAALDHTIGLSRQERERWQKRSSREFERLFGRPLDQSPLMQGSFGLENGINEPATKTSYPSMQTFGFMIANLGGRPYLVMVDPVYAEAISTVFSRDG